MIWTWTCTVHEDDDDTDADTDANADADTDADADADDAKAVYPDIYKVTPNISRSWHVCGLFHAMAHTARRRLGPAMYNRAPRHPLEDASYCLGT